MRWLSSSISQLCTRVTLLQSLFWWTKTYRHSSAEAAEMLSGMLAIVCPCKANIRGMDGWMDGLDATLQQRSSRQEIANCSKMTSAHPRFRHHKLIHLASIRHDMTRKRTWIRSKERTIDRYTWDTPAALDQTRFNYYVVNVVILTTKKENRPLLPSQRQVPGHPFPHTARRNTSVHQATCVWRV